VLKNAGLNATIRETIISEEGLLHDIIIVMSCAFYMKQDLTGQRFGRLTVSREVKREGSPKRYWLCVCDCGNEKTVEESHLKSGHTRSCGCYRKDVQREKTIDLTGQRYGRLVVLRQVEMPGRKGVFWECRCDCGNICTCKAFGLRSGTTRSCGCLQEEQRKENMKNAIHFVDGTCVERIASRKTFSTNTTGHRGVYRKGPNRWRAVIGFQGKSHYLGTFDTYEEAVEARLQAEKEMYDAFLEKDQ